MKRPISLAVMLAATLTITLPVTRAKRMTNNQKYLSEAQTCAKAFEAELEPERLRESYVALENVLLIQEHDPKTRAQLRKDSLSLWLHLLELLDRFLDPNFNPTDVPETVVQPPPVPGGVVLRPGADPALIQDAKARAEYEEAIAANRSKADRYRLQIQLGRLNARIPPRAEVFICKSYTSAASDQREVTNAIEKVIKDPRRKASLLELLTRCE